MKPRRSAKPHSAKPLSAKPLSAKPLSAKPLSAKPLSAKPLSAKPLSATSRRATPGAAATLSAAFLLLNLSHCSFDDGERWVTPSSQALESGCSEGLTRCDGDALLRCELTRDGELEWQTAEQCTGEESCIPSLGRCASCEPADGKCEEQTPLRCRADGSGYESFDTCDLENGAVCRAGRCLPLCGQASARRSNVGCEYWAADLDNASTERALNAAEQQFALVVSNPQPDVHATVSVWRDDALPGEPAELREMITDRVPPLGLRIFPLGPREVDGSLPGQPGSATHTALTRAAYQVKSNVPVVAYQFNPLDNVNVFSNDASLLKPVEALGGDSEDLRLSYVVLGWPQTIAITDDPATNFSSSEPAALRAFLTVVGTRDNTLIEITSTARTVATDSIPELVPGEAFSFELDAFDTLNLETDDFNADFTGTQIRSDGAVVVFTGSEASDAPRFEDLSERKCCADHLEEQLDHVRTAGKRFVAPVAFNRSLAVANAGGDIGVVASKEVFRVIATSAAGARVRTTLSEPHSVFDLVGLGAMREIESAQDFILESDQPVMLANISPSQLAAGVPRELPGGDPSLLIVPPIEQYRRDYVFLTPEFYAFDFLRIVAPIEAEIVLDGRDIKNSACSNENYGNLVQTMTVENQTEFTVYRCQLSFPAIDPSAEADEPLMDGAQSDGVHVLQSSVPIGVLVDGFDRHVSYAYAAGTQLEHIVSIAR